MKVYLNENSSVDKVLSKLKKFSRNNYEIAEVKDIASDLIAQICESAKKGICSQLSKTYKFEGGNVVVFIASNSKQQGLWASLKSF